MPEDPKEDPEEDPVEYHVVDDDDDDEDEASEEDEEDEHLAPADSTTLPPVGLVPLAKDIEAFETDESAPTPPSPTLCKARISKRARFTALTGRFVVGESSLAAVARQTVHTLAHRVDFRFIDNVDTSIRASESRAMTSVGEVNERVTYLTTTQRQKTYELQKKMLPKRTTTTTTTPKTDAAIKALIAQGVATALADDFLKCQPFNFKGTKGVVGLTQWFERMESVFHISNCTVACQIKFATCTLLGNALTWWNSHIKTVGHDAAYDMPWKTIKKMMTDKDCPRGEIKKLEI
uniref:Reverse transcriptase domain-containing protein n=1 Tax=Tanacetum cinerariifolium TaxID=118510 RepID=A0A6L2JIQ5_TANCI|nr:hypothetical protein [Tanacetum cinerariifolium]